MASPFSVYFIFIPKVLFNTFITGPNNGTSSAKIGLIKLMPTIITIKAQAALKPFLTYLFINGAFLYFKLHGKFI